MIKVDILRKYMKLFFTLNKQSRKVGDRGILLMQKELAIFVCWLGYRRVGVYVK